MNKCLPCNTTKRRMKIIYRCEFRHVCFIYVYFHSYFVQILYTMLKYHVIICCNICINIHTVTERLKIEQYYWMVSTFAILIILKFCFSKFSEIRQDYFIILLFKMGGGFSCLSQMTKVLFSYCLLRYISLPFPITML